MEVFVSKLKPICLQATFDSWNQLCIWLTEDHDVPSLVTFGLLPWDTWHLDVWDAWWTCLCESAREHVKEKKIKTLGGPGNRTQVPTFTLQGFDQLSCTFQLLLKQNVIIILVNNSICLKINKKARDCFKRANHTVTHHRLLQQNCWLFTCGFLSAGGFVGFP